MINSLFNLFYLVVNSAGIFMSPSVDKKPILGFLLALVFPGLGHIYANKKKNGLIFSLVTISLFLTALVSLSIYPITLSIGLYVAAFFLWIIQGLDAYFVIKQLSGDKETWQFLYTKRGYKKILIEILKGLKKVIVVIIDAIDWLIRLSFYANEKTKDLGELMLAQKTLSKLGKELDEK